MKPDNRGRITDTGTHLFLEWNVRFQCRNTTEYKPPAIAIMYTVRGQPIQAKTGPRKHENEPLSFLAIR